jgi:hypothetical protein
MPRLAPVIKIVFAAMFIFFSFYDLVVVGHEINLAQDFGAVGVTSVAGFGWIR